MAGRLAADLPAALRRRSPELSLVFGALHTGDAANVIPTTAELRGTLRTADRTAWDAAPAALTETLRELVEPTGATFELAHHRGVPPVVNDLTATELIAMAATHVLGAGGVIETEQSAGGDDFAWYLEKVRGSYARLGVHDPASDGARLDLHAGTFDVDERAIAVGVRVLVQTALEALDRDPV